MDKKNSCAQPDSVVNFKDLILYVLLRWRSILVCILVFTVLAGGFKYLTDFQSYKASVSAAQQAENTDSGLDEIELSNVKAVVSYNNILTAQAEYITTSPYMQLAPNGIHSMNISYVLSGCETYAAATLYAKHIQSATLYEEIKAKLELPYAASYLSEIIEVNLDSSENSLVEQNGKTVLNIRVWAANEQNCKDISAAVTDYIATFGNYFKDSGVTCSEPFTDYAVICDIGVGDKQQSAIIAYNNYKTNYQTALDALTGAERAYYNRLQQAGVQVSDIAKPTLSKKFLVAGFALGLILPCGIYLLAYLFGRRVKSAEDFKIRFGGTDLLGRIVGCKKKNAVDRLIIRIVCGKATKREFEGLVAGKAAITAEQNGYKNIRIVGSDAACAAALSALGNQELTVTAGGLPEAGADEFEAVKNADAVVIAAKSGETYYTEIYRTLDICKSIGKPVLGAIVVE